MKTQRSQKWINKIKKKKEADMRIQMPSMKPDIEKIHKNVKQFHGSH